MKPYSSMRNPRAGQADAPGAEERTCDGVVSDHTTSKPAGTDADSQERLAPTIKSLYWRQL